MQPPRRPADPPQPAHEADAGLAWTMVSAAARRAETVARDNVPAAFGLNDVGALVPLPDDHRDARLVWQPGTGWVSRLEPGHPGCALVDLYLPICSATAARPVVVGHLGQSLDGFIATHEGESRWVTGHENIVHMHRLRALCDAVIVGAGTVVADDPQLTARLVPGENPLRVVLDPSRRLEEHYRVFDDGLVRTMYVSARSRVAAGERQFGHAEIVAVADAPGGIDLRELRTILRARGCTRIFVEGGGVTVSAFLEAGLLDRLHVTIAPLIIGDGRPAIRLPRPSALSNCHRPRYRVFRMGADVLFDCDLSARDDGPPEPAAAAIARVI